MSMRISPNSVLPRSDCFAALKREASWRPKPHWIVCEVVKATSLFIPKNAIRAIEVKFEYGQLKCIYIGERYDLLVRLTLLNEVDVSLSNCWAFWGKPVRVLNANNYPIYLRFYGIVEPILIEPQRFVAVGPHNLHEPPRAAFPEAQKPELRSWVYTSFYPRMPWPPEKRSIELSCSFRNICSWTLVTKVNDDPDFDQVELQYETFGMIENDTWRGLSSSIDLEQQVLKIWNALSMNFNMVIVIDPPPARGDSEVEAGSIVSDLNPKALRTIAICEPNGRQFVVIKNTDYAQ